MSAAEAALPTSPSSAPDMTRRLAPFLDAHLVLRMLDFVRDSKMYPDADVLRARLDVLKRTNLVDEALKVCTELGIEPPAEVAAKQETVTKRREELGAACGPLLLLLTSEARAPQLAQLEADDEFNRTTLRDEHDSTDANVAALFPLAKFLADAGEHAAAAKLLKFYRKLIDDEHPTWEPALWGQLSAALLSGDLDTAVTLHNELKALIDRSSSTPLRQLQQRSWLLHWGLFIYFAHPKGLSMLVDLCLPREYGRGDRWSDFLCALQNNCPWLLRYLTAAVVLEQRGRSSSLQQLVRVVEQERHAYRDPATSFVEQLFVNFDFDAAQATLRECEAMLRGDFFLARVGGASVTARFMDQARLLVFETYCRVHQRLDLRVLAGKLHMTVEEAERWVVHLIRETKLDAKIDSEAGHVIMGVHYPNIYEQVISKTKDLTFRTTALATDLERRV